MWLIFDMNSLNKLQPKIIIAVALIVGTLMIVSAFIELRQSKEEIIHLLKEQSISLIETVTQSSINALNSSEEIEYLIAERLFNNARLIRELDSINILSREKLIQIGKENSLFRINIFNKTGNRVLSNRIPEPDHLHGEENINRAEELEPILKEGLNEFVIGIKDAEFAAGQRFAVAIARAEKKGAIVINLDAKSFLEFRKRIGLGKIIRDLSDNHGIEYIALQDTVGILAAGTSVDTLNSIESDSLLYNALYYDNTYTRIHPYKNREVFETIKRLVYDGEVVGLFRLGLSLDDVKTVEDRMVRRIIIISLVLAAIGIVILSVIFTTQNLRSVSNEFKKFKTFTSVVLNNMGDAVIVVNEKKLITLFNKFSEKLFKTGTNKILNKEIDNLSQDISENLNSFIDAKKEFMEDFMIETRIKNERKYLLLNFTRNKTVETEKDSYTIVIKDVTDTKKMEEETKRKEKLLAMGELASGVAHEIRNPVNAIGMIAQRLDREFKVENDPEEFHNITKLLKDEVTRINKIITQFLGYAKPLTLQIKEVNSKEFFNDLFRLFVEQARMKTIEFNKLSEQDFVIKLDPELIRQSLINLIQNALDAVEKEGIVELDYNLTNNQLIIEITDDGPGIPEELKKKIFDLYFTTKNEGTGIGLSVAQKIISEHNGTIEVFSKLNKSTKFKITLPQS
jgi:two-component system sensor histidine kinase HydH